jgi:hypothetical protein
VSNRSTTRPEDMAYCLLGIFDINMPLLYREGGVKAFRRLQNEIVKCSYDQSILAFEVHDGFWDHQNNCSDYIATYPKQFSHAGRICCIPDDMKRNLRMANTNWGMEVDLLLCPARVMIAISNDQFDGWLVLLYCSSIDDFTARPAILLHSIDGNFQNASIKGFHRWGFGLGRVCDRSNVAYPMRFATSWLEGMIGK